MAAVGTFTVPKAKPPYNDEELGQVRQALEVLSVIGYPDDAMVPMVESLQRKWGADAPINFWRVMLRRAAQKLDTAVDDAKAAAREALGLDG